MSKTVDPGNDRQRRAGVDAEQGRVGERVAGDALHDGAGETERGTDEQPDHGAGHTQRADDEVVVVVRIEFPKASSTVRNGIAFAPYASEQAVTTTSRAPAATSPRPAPRRATGRTDVGPARRRRQSTSSRLLLVVLVDPFVQLT